MNEPTEDKIRLARRGDREALESLLGAVRAQLLRHARLKLGRSLQGRIRTSDLLQTTYLDVVRSIGRFQGTNEREFAAWVTRILENNLKDKRRRMAALKRSAGLEFQADPERFKELSATQPDVSDASVFGDDLEMLRTALSSLPEDHQKVIHLRLLEGLEYEQIGEILGRSPAVARVLLVRARAGLLLETERLTRMRGRVLPRPEKPMVNPPAGDREKPRNRRRPLAP